MTLKNGELIRLKKGLYQKPYSINLQVNPQGVNFDNQSFNTLPLGLGGENHF